jgi:hypothetical protein
VTVRVGDLVEYRGTNYEVRDILSDHSGTTADLAPTRPGRMIQYGIPVDELYVIARRASPEEDPLDYWRALLELSRKRLREDPTDVRAALDQRQTLRSLDMSPRVSDDSPKLTTDKEQA